MTTLSLMPWRRMNAQGGFWNLFAWFGRACDQAAGILLNPILVAVFTRSVERDPYRMSWIVVAFSLGWLFGAAISPFLQEITERAIPWIVGGYIVRTAAIVLMAYSATDRGSSADQRFKSVLICYSAYAIATGISRSAQAHHIARDATHHLRDSRKALPVLGLALVIGITALAMWSALSSTAVSWNQSFGRVWMLASVALGVATLAAIREGVDTPETPARSRLPRRDDEERSANGLNGPVVIVLAGMAGITFVEVVSLLHFFEEFRRQTVHVRGALGLFAAGWMIGHLVWGPLRRRYHQTVLAQLAVGIGAMGIVLAMATPEIIRAGWFPDTIGGRTPLQLLVYLVGLLFGFGFSIRRMALANLFATNALASGWAGILISAGACFTPLLVGWATREYSRDWVLVGGIILAMVVMTSLGTVPVSSSARNSPRPTVQPVGHALVPRQ